MATPRQIPKAVRAALGALALVLLLLPSAADANFVYWANDSQTTIGRAKLNGTGANNSFIAGLDQPSGVAVDSKYIYWSQGNAGTSAIGRASLDGTGVNQSFITNASGVTNPEGVAVTPTHIFWANGSGTIGRANLDGSAPSGSFITAPSAHCGIAADSNFVYWTDTVASNRIGRAPVNGGISDPTFITGISAECGVAVDASFIYWGTDTPSFSIGRAAIGGTGATDAFIPAAVASTLPCGVAVNSQYVFWGNKPAMTVGQAKLNGGSPNPLLVAGASNPCLPAAAPSNKVTITGTSHNKKKGTVKINAKVPGPGQVELTPAAPATTSAAANFKTVGLTLTAAGSFKLPIKAKGKTAKTLKKKGKVKVKYFVTFTPSGVAGVTNTVKHSTTLQKTTKKKGKK